MSPGIVPKANNQGLTTVPEVSMGRTLIILINLNAISSQCFGDVVTGKLNPSMSNSSWAKKRPKLQRHGLAKITSASVLARPEGVASYSTEDWASTWDEGRIDARGEWLADRALEVWPKPQA